MRNLATIQKIKSLEAIENADAIQKAKVLGWELVVKKGEFKEGELCVYCEIDSLLPDKPEFAFLKARGMRIRTIKLRGQISQGICFGLSILPEGTKIEEGADVTELLGITKYEAPVPASLSGVAKGLFPSYIPKTDETRVQVLQDVLDRHKGLKCYISEKLDGSSVTYFLKKGQFGVCSRNLELLEDAENTLWKIARELDIENKLRSLGSDFALQGEIIGESVQKNIYKLRGQTVFFFNVFDIDQFKYLDFEEFKSMIETLGLKTAPILDTQYELNNNIAELVQLSIGKSQLFNVEREGIVIRPLTETKDITGRVSFKAINPEFLLKFD